MRNLSCGFYYRVNRALVPADQTQKIRVVVGPRLEAGWPGQANPARMVCDRTNIFEPPGGDNVIGAALSFISEITGVIESRVRYQDRVTGERRDKPLNVEEPVGNMKEKDSIGSQL